MRYEPVTVVRDCEALEIPSGRKVVLLAGTALSVMQSLGGSYTVMAPDGFMARIGAQDADAIGKEATVPAAEAAPEEPLEKRVWDVLRTCYDPEIPVNIVELGLVYECRLTPVEGGHRVDVRMTLTAPGCGMGGVLKAEAEQKLLQLAGVKEANVVLVFEPAWTREMMSEAARLQLGLL
jgi:probable FeS assembly SUF system protein SufT